MSEVQTPPPAPGQPEGSAHRGMVLGLGIAGLVIGILAVLFSLIPCLGAWAIYPGVLALILAGVATAFAFTKKTGYQGIAIAGLVLSVIAVGKGFFEYQRAKGLAEDLKDAGQQILNEAEKEAIKGIKQLQDQNK